MNGTLLRRWPWLCCWLLLLNASALRAHGNFHELLALVNEKLESAAQRTDLLLDRAQLYLEHEDLALAQADLDSVIKEDPTSKRWLLLRSKWEKLSKHWGEARTKVEQYLAAVPEDTVARWDRLEILIALGETKEALSEADKMLGTAQHQLPELVLQRVKLAEQIDAAAALQWLNAWLEGHQKLIIWEQDALRLEMKLQRTDDALARLDRMLSTVPRKEFLLLKKAQYLAELNRAPAAREALQACLEAVERLPDHLRLLPAPQAVVTDAKALLAKLPKS